MAKNKKVLLVAAGLATGLAFAGLQNLQAKNFVVTNTVDLQSALFEAGNNGEDDHIEIQQGTYLMSGKPPLYLALKDAGKELIIEGKGEVLFNNSDVPFGFKEAKSPSEPPTHAVLKIKTLPGSDFASIKIKNLFFSSNHATPISFEGTADNQSLTIERSRFFSNQTRGLSNPSAIGVYGAQNATITLLGNHFYGNESLADSSQDFDNSFYSQIDLSDPYNPKWPQELIGGMAATVTFATDANVILANNNFYNNARKAYGYSSANLVQAWVLANAPVLDRYSEACDLYFSGKKITLLNNTFNSCNLDTKVISGNISDVGGSNEIILAPNGTNMGSDVIEIYNNIFQGSASNDPSVRHGAPYPSSDFIYGDQHKVLIYLKDPQTQQTVLSHNFLTSLRVDGYLDYDSCLGISSQQNFEESPNVTITPFDGFEAKIKQGSILIDAGTTQTPIPLPDYDRHGQKRVVGLTVDIGSDELDEHCGNGTLEWLLVEKCDDGNNWDGDLCSALCIPEAKQLDDSVFENFPPQSPIVEPKPRDGENSPIRPATRPISPKRP